MSMAIMPCSWAPYQPLTLVRFGLHVNGDYAVLLGSLCLTLTLNYRVHGIKV